MLPLAGTKIPTSHDALQKALDSGLRKHGVTPTKIEVSGGEHPHVGTLKIDLTGSEITRDARLPKPEESAGCSLTVGSFTIAGEPLRLERTPVRLSITAQAAELEFQRDSAGHPTLTLSAAKDGEVHVEVTLKDLEELIRSIAAEAAAKQGVEIKSAQVELRSKGKRSLSFVAEVKAKAMLMSTKVKVSGDAEIDDKLQARLSNLSCAGDGMIGSLASGFIRPYLEKVEQKPVALMAFSLGTVKLRDISVQGGDALTLHARFSS
jgi:hypothetical protein